MIDSYRKLEEFLRDLQQLKRQLKSCFNYISKLIYKRRLNQKQKNLEFSKVFSQFLVFLQSNDPKSIEEKYESFKLFNALIDFPLISIENPKLLNK